MGTDYEVFDKELIKKAIIRWWQKLLLVFVPLQWQPVIDEDICVHYKVYKGKIYILKMVEGCYS